jgi:hypothetical protein
VCERDGRPDARNHEEHEGSRGEHPSDIARLDMQISPACVKPQTFSNNQTHVVKNIEIVHARVAAGWARNIAERVEGRSGIRSGEARVHVRSRSSSSLYKAGWGIGGAERSGSGSGECKESIPRSRLKTGPRPEVQRE